MTKHLNLLLFLTLSLLLGNYAQADNQTSAVVTVSGGQIQGTVQDGVSIYKGIPFAAPPLGDLRWKDPQPVQSWSGVLTTSNFKPAPMQRPWAKIDISEDCLYLNVWTPAKQPDEKLPVMVWIYGGAFAGGSTSYTDGLPFAKQGVIYVSIAYRVGALGFMTNPELNAESPHHTSGNYGILDQIAGLKWVQENISKFGGDPSKVTIFGESAGAISVSILCASPLCKGLFRAAISESGGSFGPKDCGREYNGVNSLKTVEQRDVDFMKSLGAQSIADLRKVDAEKLIDDPTNNFWPIIDGYAITDDQYLLYQQGKYNDVNIMVGTNSDEGAMFSQATNVASYKKQAQEKYGKYYNRIMKAYPAKTDEETAYAAADIFREAGFAWPTYAWAKLQYQTGKKNVFVYYFDQPQPIDQRTGKRPRGANHASEIPYVYKVLQPDVYTQSDKQLSDIMSAYWVNFAKNGNPNGQGLPNWPAYDNQKQKVMWLHMTPEAKSWAHKSNLLLMEELFKDLRNNHSIK